MYLTQTIFFFFPANAKLLQSLRRCRASSLCTREPLELCEHCGKVPCSSKGRPMVARAPTKNNIRRVWVSPPVCKTEIRRNAVLRISGFGTYFMLCAPGRPLRRPRAPRGGERAIFASVCGKIGKCWKTVSELPAFLSGGFSTTGRKTRLP